MKICIPERALDRNTRTRSRAIEDYESSNEENESITHLKTTIAAIKSIVDPEDFQLIIKQQALMVKEMTRLARDISDIKDEIKTIRPALQGSQSTAQAASSNYSVDIVISDEIYRDDMSKLISVSLLVDFYVSFKEANDLLSGLDLGGAKARSCWQLGLWHRN
ncbi:hypothetical protein [Parasitella parasitica]|uniref:Uncharacterized protein n=1 Tax=Parasitella parasitica TaxID=35722 RepID=A0A0B7NWM8_9FUNG|nr:hypothetical protein [Parasitella parasitica]